MRREHLGVGAGLALLGLGAVVGGSRAAAVLDLGGPTVDRDPRVAPLPAPTPAALWAGPLAEPAPPRDLERALGHHPGLVVAAAARPGEGSPAGHAALAAAAADPVLDAVIARRLRLEPAERAWAVDPALADAAARACPDPAMAALCGPTARAVVEAQVDVVLGEALRDPDPAVVDAARAAVCRLGPTRAAAIVAGLPPPPDAAARALDLRLAACADGRGAGDRLREAALGSGPVAAVAVLELRALGLPPPAEVPARTAAGIAAGAGAP